MNWCEPLDQLLLLYQTQMQPSPMMSLLEVAEKTTVGTFQCRNFQIFPTTHTLPLVSTASAFSWSPTCIKSSLSSLLHEGRHLRVSVRVKITSSRDCATRCYVTSAAIILRHRGKSLGSSPLETGLSEPVIIYFTNKVQSGCRCHEKRH